MTRKQFEELDYFKDEFNVVDVDSIVLLPTRKHHESGYKVFYAIACYRSQPIGKCFGFDAFDMLLDGKFKHIGIDCLRGSGLMRIFLPTNEYVIKPYLHQIVKKEK